MTDFPLTLRQLINVTAGELGLGEADRHALGLALIRAYTIGIKEANRITADEHARSNATRTIPSSITGVPDDGEGEGI